MEILIGLLILIVVVFILPSIRTIGATEIGLVTKRFGLKRLSNDNPIAFHGEAGYQADLLMPGMRFKFFDYLAAPITRGYRCRRGRSAS